MMRGSVRAAFSLPLVLALAVSLSLAQAPTGTIAGAVSDASEAAIPGALLSITNKATGRVRMMPTGVEGLYSAAALPAGEYEVKVEASGFKTVTREATVVTGSTTMVNFSMPVGATAEAVTVEAATSQILYDSHKIDGVVTRTQIENLPLNGRSFLQLAMLEPGVSVGTLTLTQRNEQFQVSILGGDSRMTAITVDGGNVRNHIEGNTGMNFSQEVVEEFQISTTNFDLSTGITGVGSINIVTRSGKNDLHGSGYFFFRDHNIAAYPHLQRNAFNADPFFARRQSGFWVGGPIRRDKLFFFTNLEHNNQDGVQTIQPNSVFFAALAQNAVQPYTGKQFSQRFDYLISQNHSVFLRYSHDGNRGLGPSGGGARLPSNWLRNTNWADQSLVGLTSTLRPTLVNDFRFSYWYWRNRNLFPREEDCPGCIGLGMPQMQILGSNVYFGNTSNATQGRDLRRFVWTDHLAWQRGTHRVRFGGEFEYAPGTGFWGFADPAAGAVWGPDLLPPAVRALFGFPSSFTTNQDLLRLPVFLFVMGIGDPGQPPPFRIDYAKRNHRVHLFWQDTWRLRPRFTINYGLAWSHESRLLNHDLDKPQLLAPLLGADGIRPTEKDYNNFSPSLGFAWNVTQDNRTVIRGGAGIYYDTRVVWQRLRERATIGPLGNGRIQYPGSAVPNPIPNLPGVALGTPLEFRTAPSAFTMGALMQILPSIRGQAERAATNPNPNDLSIRNINIQKSGVDLIPHHYPTIYSEHFSLGMQRELGRNLVLNTDFVFRQFLNQEIGGIDYNRFQRVQGPVIPRCTSPAQAADPRAQCSTGPMTFFEPSERSNYKALLVKLDKRFSSRYQFTLSYALAGLTGMNGIANLDNWFSTWGPRGGRHTLNFSTVIDLPAKFQVSFISSASTRGPVRPNITAIDLDGDGSDYEPLPGIDFKKRDLSRSEISTLVDRYNQTYAGRPTVRNPAARYPTLGQPSNYEFGDQFTSQDLRLTKIFQFAERYKISVFGEVFNVFNIANLGGYSFDLTNLPAFGRPTVRSNQVFGSGGPRAFQLGARFNF